MIIVLKPRTSDENVKRVENMVRAKGLEVHTVKGEDLTIIGCIGDTVRVDPKLFEVDSSVEKVMHVQEPYKLVNRAFHPDDTCVSLEKQFKMMEIILYLNQKCRNLIAMGMPMSVLRQENIFEKVISIKYDVPNDKLEIMDDYQKAVDDFYDTVMEKNG
mgnify:CR=1 FL=1